MVNIEFENNYIVCGSSGFYDIAYDEIKTSNNVKYYNSHWGKYQIKNLFLYKLSYRSWFSSLVQFLTFDKIVQTLYESSFYDNKKQLVYIVFGNIYSVLGYTFFKKLKRLNNNAKFVLYMQDIISVAHNFDLNEVKSIFDIVISYDENDANNYNLQYYPTPYSQVQIEDNDEIKQSDIYFIGKAKTRFNTIIDIFEKCLDAGLKIDFNIMEVPKKQRVYSDLINYEKSFSYSENLQHLKKTNCVLEIMQENAVGYTPRLWEAITYDKYFITNNYNLEKSFFFSKDNMQIIKNKNFDLSHIKERIHYSAELKNKLSPINFLLYVDSLIMNL